MKRLFICVSCFLLPSFLLRPLLRLLGCRIGDNVKIGFSLILMAKVDLLDNVKIGHFNFIKVSSLLMQNGSYIGNFNFIRGPINLHFKDRAAIGRSNIIRRSPLGISYGNSDFLLGELSKITACHFLDLTRSIRFGDFSILAGIRSQLWTHGYVHAESGPDRFRVDGEIKIGNNVYIGSGVIINPGVEIGDAVIVGGGATVAKSILEKGMYVSQPLRYIPKGYDDFKENLTRVEGHDLVEIVYEK